MFGDLHPKGIWREMFITQPPSIRVHVEIYQRCVEDLDEDQDVYDRQFVIRTVTEGSGLERGDGVKLGDLYDHLHHEYYQYYQYNRYGKPLSVRTTVHKYVTETNDLPDRTPCIVRNREVRLPSSLPDLPDDECDAFGGDVDYASECGSWRSEDREQHLSEEYYGEYDVNGNRFEDVQPGSSSYDSEQEGDGELDDEDSRRPPLQITRVNVYMPSRQSTARQDSSEEGFES